MIEERSVTRGEYMTIGWLKKHIADIPDNYGVVIEHEGLFSNVTVEARSIIVNDESREVIL
jgi:hypothetical protein